MTASATEPSANDWRVARYAALAIALSVLEAAVPSPIPGVKPGLANIVTLLVLWRHGWQDAAWVTGLRVFGAALALGGLLSPGFALSCAGSVASLATLALVRHLPRHYFGPVSLSVLAAYAHIAGQLALARAWLIPHDGIVKLLPIFMLTALIFGIVNGVIAARILGKPA
ncbi:Gx transporter family protein [Chitinolyticbacter meiyuanensis]|uniref:Gx transporter family protein n=1 Tax=Chitinolyticbacter meiyuanensis TaxID=682798 RepID=UPI0011E5F17C|nr:Gx transporter family protein [Chitinolyticbacter meiyuanensis]